VLASHGPVALFLHRGEPEVAHIVLFHSQLRATIREYPDGVGLLFVIADTSGLPSNDVRTAASAVFRELGPKIRLLGAAFEGEGFGSAAKRSVFTLVASSIFGSIRMRVHGSAEAACHWLDEQATGAALRSPSEIELIGLVDRARRA